jgi:hypothetical protein
MQPRSPKRTPTAPKHPHLRTCQARGLHRCAGLLAARRAPRDSLNPSLGVALTARRLVEQKAWEVISEVAEHCLHRQTRLTLVEVLVE